MRNKKNVGSPSMSLAHQKDEEEEEEEESLSIPQLLAKKIMDQSTSDSDPRGKDKETGKNKKKKTSKPLADETSKKRKLLSTSTLAAKRVNARFEHLLILSK